MIHHCSGSSHDHYKCSFYHSILLWGSWCCIFKTFPNSFLSDTLSRTLFSPALSHLIILTWIPCLAFKAIIQSIIGLTCSFLFFKIKLFFYFAASSTNTTQCCLPPMPCLLIDEIQIHPFSRIFLLFSFFFGIFSLSYFSMSRSGNY